MIGWCELRNAFRTFRTDRIVEASDAGRLFRAERGKTLADFYRLMEMSEYNAFKD
ncbi:transcriptional regulator [Brucella abortus]|nr:transcriptional regulator [Brucella abortus]